MPYSVIFFDLDETLYPGGTNLWHGILARIEDFMRKRLNIPMEDVPALRMELFRDYGTTMRGLQITRSIDAHEFLAYVHDVPLDELIPNPAVRAMLLELPLRRMIFTIADRDHARRVLDRLELSDCFEQIIDILDIAPHCKPQTEAFNIALHLSGETDGRRCILIDDSVPNLETARELGFLTFYAGSENEAGLSHPMIKNLADLPLLLNKVRSCQSIVRD